MAINKRFLGLGFSFAATDKGLEKKLKGIQKALAGINEELDTMGKSSSSSSRAMSKMKQPKGSRPRQAASERVTRERAFHPKSDKTAEQANKLTDQQPKLTTKLFQDALDDLSKADTAFMDRLFSSFGNNKDLIEAFTRQSESLKVVLDENNNLTEESRKGLKRYADLFVQRQKSVDKSLGKISEKVRGVFLAISNYAKNLKGSVETFLRTMGVDLSGMIPQQITAAFGVIKTALAPILSLPKLFMKSAQEKLLSKSNEKLAAIDRQMAKLGRAIGSSKQDSVKKLLEKVVDNTQPQKKSLLDKLKDAFMKVFSSVGSVLGKLLSPLAGLMKGAGAIGGAIGKALPMLGSLFKGIAQIFTRFGGAALRVVSVVAVLGSALFGFSSGISEHWERLRESFGNLFDATKGLVAALWGLVSEKLSPLFGIVGKITDSILSGIQKIAPSLYEAGISTFAVLGAVLEDVGKLLVKLITAPFQTIASGWKNIGSLLGGLAADAADSLAKTAKAKTEELRAIPAQSAPIERNLSRTAAENSREQIDLMRRQVSVMEENNMWQRRMYEQGERPPVPPQVNVTLPRGRGVTPGAAEQEAVTRGMGGSGL